MNWYLDVLKNKYATFSGRARRKEYWFFVLFNMIASVVLFGIDVTVGLGSVDMGIGALSGIYALAVLIPSLAVGIRRLHDTNRSGWWILISLVPFVGGLILLVLLTLDSDEEANKYGDNPKQEAAVEPSGMAF